MLRKRSNFENFNPCTSPRITGYYERLNMDEVEKQSTQNPNKARWFSARYKGSNPLYRPGYIYAIYVALDDNDEPFGKAVEAPNPPWTTDVTIG